MDVNNVALKISQKTTLQRFYGEGNALNMFVRPQGYKQFAFVKNKQQKKSPVAGPMKDILMEKVRVKSLSGEKKKRQHLESHRKREGIRSQIRRRGESVLKLESGKKCGGTRKEAGQRKIFNSRVQALTAQGYRPKRTTSSLEREVFFFSILIHSLSSRPPPQATT